MGPIKVMNRLIHKIADMTMFKIVGNDYTYLYNVSWVIHFFALKFCGSSEFIAFLRRILELITRFANVLQTITSLQLPLLVVLSCIYLHRCISCLVEASSEILDCWYFQDAILLIT